MNTMHSRLKTSMDDAKFRQEIIIGREGPQDDHPTIAPPILSARTRGANLLHEFGP